MKRSGIEEIIAKKPRFRFTPSRLLADVKGEAQVENPQGESTNAEHRGGSARSSDEVSVMEMERRG